MDEQFVQGVIGGVLNRHKNRTLDKNRIRTLMVEIAANIDIATQYTNVKEVQKAVDNPLNIEMWKGYKKTIKEEELSKEYLDYWTCDICDENTHEVDYDYLGNGTNHLGCELKEEELQKKSDKIMEQLEIDFKDYDLSKAESNEWMSITGIRLPRYSFTSNSFTIIFGSLIAFSISTASNSSADIFSSCKGAIVISFIK